MSEPAESGKSVRRVAIVGAGITGLSAALRLILIDEHVHLEVFESSSGVGGIIHTERRDGFLIEHGPDSFITNKPGGVQLCHDLGISDQLLGTDDRFRRSLVVHKGQPVAVPDGFMLMAPAKPMAILTTPVLSAPGKLRLLSEAFRPRKKSDEDESLASFVRRRFGSEALDRLVQPLVGGIYTSDPEKLSLQATLPRFLTMEREHGSVIRATLAAGKNTTSGGDETSGSGARYGLFAAPADGLSSLINALQNRLSDSGRVTFHFDTPVQAVNPGNGRDARWTVLTTDHASTARTFDQVIVTTPAWAAARLLKGCDDDALVQSLTDIEYASSAIVVSGHRLSDFKHRLDAFGLVVPAVENRKVLAVSFTSRKFPGRAPEGHVLLRTFVGGAMQPELFDKSDDDIRRMVRDELKSLLGMQADPAFSTVARYARSMPQYHVGHLDRVRRIDERVSEHSGLEIAGNAYTGVGIPDSIASGYGAADRLAGHSGEVTSEPATRLV